MTPSAILVDAYALGERIGEVDRDGVNCDQTLGAARAQRGDLDAIDDLILRFGQRPPSHRHRDELRTRAGRSRPRRERLYQRFHHLGVVWPRLGAADLVEPSKRRSPSRRAATSGVAPFGRCSCPSQVAGSCSAVVSSHGVPSTFFLAMLDAAVGDLDVAVEGFERARMSAEQLGARPWVVHARAGLARALMARAAPGDHDDAKAAADRRRPTRRSRSAWPLCASTRRPTTRARRGREPGLYETATSGPSPSMARPFAYPTPRVCATSMC